MFSIRYVLLLGGLSCGTSFADTNALLASGNYKKAVEEALASSKRNHAAGNRAAEKEDINTMGLAHLYGGDYDEADREFQKALELDRQLGDAMGEVVRLNNIGNVDFFRAKYLEGSKAYSNARAILDRNVQSSLHSRLLARTLANQAVLLQRIGQYDAALPLYEKLSENLQGSERARMLANKGTLLRRLGDAYLAMDAYREAEALFRDNQDADGEIGVLKNRGIALAFDLREPESALRIFDVALARALQTSNRREVTQVHLYRADALRRAGRAAESRHEAEEALTLARGMNSTEDEWKALFLIGKVDREHPLEFFLRAVQRIESTRSELGPSLLKRDFLADKREVYDAAINLMLSGPPAELFSMLEHSRARALETRFPPISLQDLQKQIDPETILIETWSDGVKHAALIISPERAFVTRWEVPDLRPIPELNRKSLGRVVVVPDGDLQQPFETLPLSDGRILIEQASVSYLPTGSMLRSDLHRAWRFPWQHNTLALAVPDPPGEGKARLDHAADEAKDAASTRTGASMLRIGAEATGGLLSYAEYPVIHVAAHAVSNPFSAEGSRLLLGSGPVYLRDVYSWDLSKVLLVTLSACETENGELIRGEGPAGFSRALLYAGANSTITTLWPVADAPTATFMRVFYQQFRQGVSVGESLREAKLRFLHSHTSLKDPKYWAAFLVTGNANTRAPTYISWWALASPMILLLALLGFYWINR